MSIPPMSDAWLEADRLFKDLAASEKRRVERERAEAAYKAKKEFRDAEEWARKASIYTYSGLILVCLGLIFLPGLIQRFLN